MHWPATRRAASVVRHVDWSQQGEARNKMSLALEQHFTLPELAKRWHVDYKTVQRWFENREDVLKFGIGHRPMRRRHISIRVPASAAEKVYRERLAC